MKKIITLLAIALISANAWSYDFYRSNTDGIIIYYSIISFDDKTLEVTYGSSKYNSYSGGINVPSSLTYMEDTYSVTRVGANAFRGCSNLKVVKLPATITSIESSAFYECGSLIGITIQGSLTSIGDYAFYGCSRLTSITIPDEVTSIGQSAFYECSGLTEVNSLNSTPPTCGSECFYYVTKNIPLSVPRGSSAAYRSATGWKEFSYIREGHFSVANADGKTIYYDIISEADKIVEVTSSDDTENPYNGTINIPSSVIYESVTYHVESICPSAFSGCSGLTSVTIPDAVTSIGNKAFSGCSGLTTVNFNATNCTNMGSYDSWVFIGCTALKTLNIGGNVQNIPAYAFSGCSSLTSVTIPKEVTSIGWRAFSECSGLTTVNFNATNCTKMGYDSNSVFTGCTALKTLNIGDNVQNIPDYAFWGCNGLTSINIPNGVTSIGIWAFYECNGLITVTIGNFVMSIGDCAFYGCTGLTVLTIGNSVKSIGERAFRNCTGLTSVTIPDGVTSIGRYAFLNCSNLTSINIPDEVTSIGESAFSYCAGLTSVTIPDGVTIIGTGAFSNCSGLTAINVAADNPNYTSLDGALFNKNKSVLIQYPAKKVGHYSIPNSVTIIGDYAFSYCSGLTSVTIPDGVTSIRYYAFSNCTGLTSVTIPDGVTIIVNNAFSNCTGLTKIHSLRITPPTCGSDCFYNITKNIPLYVPKGSKAAYQSAYRWKEFTNIIETDFTGVEVATADAASEAPYIADGNLTVTGLIGGAAVSIYGIGGQLVETVYADGETVQIDLSTQPKGIYIVVVNGKSYKVVK